VESDDEQLVAEYEASGMGRTVFCQQRGISLSMLNRYRRRQERIAGETAAGKRWLAVELGGSAAAEAGTRASGLTVVLPGGRWIEVGRGFDADILKRLLAVVAE
jgi:hypothetical protein